MPFRNMYLRDLDGCLELITPSGLPNPESNIFDKAFDADSVGFEDWNDWMRWEGGIEAPTLDRKQSSRSTVSSKDNYYSDNEGAETDEIYASLMAENEFSFEDAPFELEETMQHPQSLAARIENGAALTQSEVPRERLYRGYSSLTQAEEQSLQNIAMPYLLSKVKINSKSCSPTASHSLPSLSPSSDPETRTRKSKKRKSSIDEADIPSALCQSRKRGHNAIEKRYRTNLNDKINCLRQGVPALCRPSSSDSKSGDEAEDSDDGGVDSKTGQKYGKAAILTRALEYIKHLEATTERLGGEVTVLKTRVGAFEKLAMSGSIILHAAAGTQFIEPLIVKSETLESIQADFKQIKPKQKTLSRISALSRKRGSRQTKGR